jgi:hypothetical protein
MLAIPHSVFGYEKRELKMAKAKYDYLFTPEPLHKGTYPPFKDHARISLADQTKLLKTAK